MTLRVRLLHGVYPEQYVEILPLPLHFVQGQGQNDRRRRVRNDNIVVVGTDSICANYFCQTHNVYGLISKDLNFSSSGSR